MSNFENIKKYCASLELLYDFSEFRGRFSLKKVFRFILRISLLIPCFYIYLALLTQILILELIGFFLKIPSDAISRLRSNSGYDIKEFKWLFILTYLILYIFLFVFDIIRIILPIYLRIIAFQLDAVLWIAHLGDSEFVNLNIAMEKEGKQKTKLIWVNASNRSFSEFVVIFVLGYLLPLISLWVYFDSYYDYEFAIFVFLLLSFAFHLGIFLYYKHRKFPEPATE
jgi:heme/copper-type cytochrome/quinol oxidase subunit 4